MISVEHLVGPGWLSRSSCKGICRFLIVMEHWLEERFELKELLERVESRGYCGNSKCYALIILGMLNVVVTVVGCLSNIKLRFRIGTYLKFGSSMFSILISGQNSSFLVFSSGYLREDLCKRVTLLI